MRRDASAPVRRALVRGLGVRSRKWSVPAVKTKEVDPKNDEELLETGSAMQIRSLAETLNQMSIARGAQHAAKEAPRWRGARREVGRDSRKLGDLRRE